MKPVIFCWSGGKDSALALHWLLEDNTHRVMTLIVTVNEGNNRVSMHGLRYELTESQANALQIPIDKVTIEQEAGNSHYEEQMLEVFSKYKEEEGVDTIVYGDVFLEDVRTYREQLAERINMKSVFPLWLEDTKKLTNQFIDKDFKAVTLCIDRTKLSRDFIGREMDKQFWEALPSTVDPCGENGEFHSFVYDSPDFSAAIPFTKGEIVTKTYPPPYENTFTFCDIQLTL